MDFEKLVQLHMNHLGETDKTIVSYIINHQEEVSKMSISDLEKKVYTSKATILRFTKKLGFSGYSEMRFHLKQALENNNDASPIHTPQDFIHLQKKDIHDTVSLLTTIKHEPLLLTIQACEVFYCYATGFYQRKALEEFYQLFLTYEKKVIVISDKRELDMIMPTITKQDIILFASVSGETEAVKENIQLLKLRKVPIVSITTFGDNFFSRHSDFQLFYYATPIKVGKTPNYRISMIGLNIVLDFLFRKYGAFCITHTP